MRSLVQEHSRPRVGIGGHDAGYRKIQPCETNSAKSLDHKNGEKTETFSLSR